jgi:hypothetical protein
MPTPRYDKSKLSTRGYDWVAGQKIAIGAAATDSTAIDSIEVMLRPSVRCFITVAATAAEATAADAAGSIPLEAGESFHIQIPQGWFLSVIRATSDGWLYLLPVA